MALHSGQPGPVGQGFFTLAAPGRAVESPGGRAGDGGGEPGHRTRVPCSPAPPVRADSPPTVRAAVGWLTRHPVGLTPDEGHGYHARRIGADTRFRTPTGPAPTAGRPRHLGRRLGTPPGALDPGRRPAPLNRRQPLRRRPVGLARTQTAGFPGQRDHGPLERVRRPGAAGPAPGPHEEPADAVPPNRAFLEAINKARTRRRSLCPSAEAEPDPPGFVIRDRMLASLAQADRARHARTAEQVLTFTEWEDVCDARERAPW